MEIGFLFHLPTLLLCCSHYTSISSSVFTRITGRLMHLTHYNLIGMWDLTRDENTWKLLNLYYTKGKTMPVHKRKSALWRWIIVLIGKGML